MAALNKDLNYSSSVANSRYVWEIESRLVGCKIEYGSLGNIQTGGGVDEFNLVQGGRGETKKAQRWSRT